MSETSDLLFRWLRKAKVAASAHSAAAATYERMHRMVGMQTVLLSVLAATFYSLVSFSGNLAPFGELLRFIPVVLSIIVAVFAALHTFLGYERKAKDHQISASQYSSIERQIETFLAVSGSSNKEQIGTFLETIRAKFDGLAEVSPSIPEQVYRRIVRRFDIERYESAYDQTDVIGRGSAADD